MYFGRKNGQWAMIKYFWNFPQIYYFSEDFVLVLAGTSDRELGSLFSVCAPKRESGKSLHLKIAWIQMWRKIRLLLVIITLRFTCGERKNVTYQTIPKCYVQVKVSSNVFSQSLFTYVTNMFYNSLRFYEREIDIVSVSNHMYVIDTVMSRNRSVENRLSFALRKLSGVTVKWNVTEKRVYSIEKYERICHSFDFHISTTSNKKKSWLSSFERSKVDPFPFVFVSLKISVLQLLIFLFFVVLYFNRGKRFDSFPKWIVEVNSFSSWNH